MAALRVPFVRWVRAALALATLAAVGCAPKGSPGTAPPPRETVRPAATPRAYHWSAGERLRVAREMRALLEDALFDDAGIEIVAADGTQLFARRERRSLVPASTMKLFVAAASLATFGPQHRFETRAVARSEPRDGILPSPLWLVGGGDPALASNDLRGAAQTLALRGIRRIEGPLVADGSLFPGGETNPTWSADDLLAGYAVASSALSLDGDTVEVSVIPTTPGAVARIELEPPDSGVRIAGTIRTVGSGAPAEFSLDREGLVRGGDSNVFRASGEVADGETQHVRLPVFALPRYAGHAFAAMLARRKIALAGGVEVGAAPGDAVALWTHRSPPLARLVREMLFQSDNHAAEQLLRLLAVDGFGAGNDTDGIRTEQMWLSRWMIPRAGLRIVDGSGLSAANRVTAAALAALLRAQLREPPETSIAALLPRVGIEGTVRLHVLHSGAGRVRAKSGHLLGVNALAGIVTSRKHGPIVFAFISNGPHAGADRLADREDLALDRLAEF